MQTGLNEHFSLVTSQRNYGTWLFFNLLDLAIFAGIPMAIAFIGAALMAIRKIGRGSISEAQILTLSTAVLILILNLSGSTRGEVGRIWLFFMPLMVISGTTRLVEQLPNWRWQWGWAGAQLAWAVALGLSWQPIQATIVVAEQPPFPTLPSNSIPTDVTFGSHINLNQTALSQSKDNLTITFAWQVEGPSQRPYTVFNHLIDSQGNLVAQADSWPVDGLWPPTCWQAGELVIDQHQIILPDSLPSGNYTLLTGLYDARDGIRLLTQAGDDHVVTGQITHQSQ